MIDNNTILDLNSESIKKLVMDCNVKYSTKKIYRIPFEQKRMGYPQDSKPISLDAESVDENVTRIAYLFGQLKTIHSNSKIIPIKDILKKYNGTFWANEKSSPIFLIHLGMAAGLILPPDFQTKSCLMITDILPTLSPKDPNFQSWYEQNKSKILKKKGGQEPADD